MIGRVRALFAATVRLNDNRKVEVCAIGCSKWVVGVNLNVKLFNEGCV